MNVTVPTEFSADWLWGLFGLGMLWALKAYGDQRWQLRKTDAEQRIADDAHERRTIDLCNEEYIRQNRYEADMGRISGIMTRLQMDIGVVEVTLAKQGAAIEAMATTMQEHGQTLRDILLHTRQLNERDREWYEAGMKRHSSEGPT